MYATLAIGLDGRTIPLDIKCMGDGNPKNACGKTLYFSHDSIHGDHTHRYASCLDRHTWAFTFATDDLVGIPVQDKGELIDDTAGRPKVDLKDRPIVIGMMTNDEDVFLEHAPLLQEITERSGNPEMFRIVQAAEPIKPPPKRPKKQPPKRKRRPKRT